MKRSQKGAKETPDKKSEFEKALEKHREAMDLFKQLPGGEFVAKFKEDLSSLNAPLSCPEVEEVDETEIAAQSENGSQFIRVVKGWIKREKK